MKERFNVIVEDSVGGRTSRHVREVGIRPAKIEDVFRSVVEAQSERLLRFARGSDAPIESIGSISDLDVTGFIENYSTHIFVEKVVK